MGIDNSKLSCQPTAGQIVIQNQWFQFQCALKPYSQFGQNPLPNCCNDTGSSYNPLFNQVDDVHIYLFNGDSGDQVGLWTENKLQGSIQVQVNDTFWGAAGPAIQPNHNQSFSFYFVIIPSTAVVHNGETSEATFTGVRA